MNQGESMGSSLFRPVTLGALELPNRMVMAPLTRCRADNAEYAPTPMMAKYYALRAGAGLIVSEATIVSAQGRGYPDTPGIWSDAQVEGWGLVTDAVHAAGGRIVCQLWHCGRLSLPEFHGGLAPVAPSAINPDWKMLAADGLKPTVTPRALSREDIAGVVGDFGRAARNAMRAGFDGVEIHSSNGYLIHQFLSCHANHRSDEYGGSIENRARFFFEVLDAVVAEVPPGRVGFRLNPMMNRVHGLQVDEGTLPTFEYVVRGANEYRLAWLHLTEPYLPGKLEGTSGAIPEVAPYFRPIAKMPIISNGGFDREKAELWLDKGLCDAVAFGRLFISNPDLPERYRKEGEIAGWDADTFYQGGERGYLDYPLMSA
jgi:N-ethylmaleimide reductase